MILGLDISSSIIGYSILDDNGKLIRIGFINISRLDDLLEKAKFVFFYFKEILLYYKIDKIYIEDISKKFRPGFSSAQIITLLAKFNGIVSYIVYNITGIKPNYIMASSARKIAYSRSFPKNIDIKEEILKEFTKLEKDIKWPLKRNGKLINGVYDACDAYTMSLAGFKIG